jgi:hypothetical protein
MEEEKYNKEIEKQAQENKDKPFYWLNNLESYLAVGFKYNEIKKAVNYVLNIRDLTTTEQYIHVPQYLKQKQLIKEGDFYFEEYQNDWTRKVLKRGFEYKVCSNYQNLNTDLIVYYILKHIRKEEFYIKFVKNLTLKEIKEIENDLKKTLPHVFYDKKKLECYLYKQEIKKGSFTVYSVDRKDADIYFNIKNNDSVYLTLRHLLNKDVEKLEERHQNYFGCYDKNNKERLKDDLNLLNSSKFKKLKVILKNNK